MELCFKIYNIVFFSSDYYLFVKGGIFSSGMNIWLIVFEIKFENLGIF